MAVFDTLHECQSTRQAPPLTLQSIGRRKGLEGYLPSHTYSAGWAAVAVADSCCARRAAKCAAEGPGLPPGRLMCAAADVAAGARIPPVGDAGVSDGAHRSGDDAGLAVVWRHVAMLHADMLRQIPYALRYAAASRPWYVASNSIHYTRCCTLRGAPPPARLHR